MPQNLKPVIQVVRRGFNLEKKVPQWAYTYNTIRNHLKKKIVSEEIILTLPGRTNGQVGQRVEYIYKHNLGHVPFIEAYAKGSRDDGWRTIPSQNIQGTNCPPILCGTTQGEDEIVFHFYVIDISTQSFPVQQIKLLFTINFDPARDAWDS